MTYNISKIELVKWIRSQCNCDLKTALNTANELLENKQRAEMQQKIISDLMEIVVKQNEIIWNLSK